MKEREFLNMDFWHEIVDDYNYLGKKDHGMLSEKTAVILLIYLTFGPDYPSGITQFFKELSSTRWFGRKLSTTLLHPNKVSSVLKKMRDDGLVLLLLKKAGTGAAPRLYYALDPQIIQRPIKTCDEISVYPIEIPIDKIETFLKWMALDTITNALLEEQMRQERHKRADLFIKRVIYRKTPDYHHQFLSFLKEKAQNWESETSPNNQHPFLSEMISHYIFELDAYADDEIN